MKKRTLILAVLAVVLVLSSGIGSAIAYFTTYATARGGYVIHLGGKTEIECYAQWITTSGNIYKDWKFLLPDGGCLIDTPTEPDLYLLRVVTDKQTRSFKFIIQ